MKAMPGAIVSIGSPFSENGTVIEVHEVNRIKGECALARMNKIKKTGSKHLEMDLISNQFNIGVAQEVITGTPFSFADVACLKGCCATFDIF